MPAASESRRETVRVAVQPPERARAPSSCRPYTTSSGAPRSSSTSSALSSPAADRRVRRRTGNAAARTRHDRRRRRAAPPPGSRPRGRKNRNGHSDRTRAGEERRRAAGRCRAGTGSATRRRLPPCGSASPRAGRPRAAPGPAARSARRCAPGSGRAPGTRDRARSSRSR